MSFYNFVSSKPDQMSSLFQLESGATWEHRTYRSASAWDVDARHHLLHPADGGALQRGVPLPSRSPLQWDHYGAQAIQGRVGVCHGRLVLPLRQTGQFNFLKIWRIKFRINLWANCLKHEREKKSLKYCLLRVVVSGCRLQTNVAFD